MTTSIAIHVVRTGWPHLIQGNVVCTPVTRGRFSSDPLWKVQAESGAYSLRGSPPGKITQARRSHAFVRNLSTRFGLPLPVAAIASSSTSLYEAHGAVWELATWLAGQPLDEEPNLEQLMSAAKALGQLHVVARDAPVETTFDPIQKYGDKVDGLCRYLQLGHQVEAPIECWSSDWPEMPRALLQASDRVLADLNSLRKANLPVQWTWGDAWHGNYLYEGNKVVAVVDFAAVRVDTPLADIARLLGAATPYDSPAWRAGLEAYDAVLGLSENDRSIVSVLYHAATVLSLSNWLSWYSRIEQMPDPQAGFGRLEHFAGRLAAYLGFSKRSV